MSWLKLIVVVLAAVEGGWLLFDGAHALITGDYVTPSSGPYEGQLGPWAALVSAVGLDPRSTLVMIAHVVVGATWLGVIVSFVKGVSWSWGGMVALAVIGLGYLPFGTLMSLVQLGLLMLPALRRPLPEG